MSATTKLAPAAFSSTPSTEVIEMSLHIRTPFPYETTHEDIRIPSRDGTLTGPRPATGNAIPGTRATVTPPSGLTCAGAATARACRGRYDNDVHYMGGSVLAVDMHASAATMHASVSRPPDPLSARVRSDWSIRLRSSFEPGRSGPHGRSFDNELGLLPDMPPLWMPVSWVTRTPGRLRLTAPALHLASRTS
jgi:hypothetical protein